MTSNQPGPWAARLHALWRVAFDAVSMKGFSAELYLGLLEQPDACAVVGVRLGPEGSVRVTRWADSATGLTTAPPGLDTDVGAWPETADVVEELTLEQVAERSPGLAARLAGAGARGLLMAAFTVAEGERGLLGVGISTEGPACRETVEAVAQVTDLVVAVDHRISDQREQDEKAADAFLAEASLRLAESLDIEDTLRAVVRMAVPGLADGAAVHIKRNGRMEQIAVAHVDARRERVLAGHLADGRWAGGPVVAGTDRTAWDDSPSPSGLPADAGLGLMTISVLRARGRDVGLLTIFHRGGAPRRTSTGFLRDLAARAALAIDNATLYEQRRTDVLSLQQHLLPAALPAVPGLEFASGYQVADHTLSVGGDFYGVVPQRGGDVPALIGDVCGRGAPAAAVTGLARHTLETILEEGGSAEHAVRTLNAKMLRNDVTRFITLATATFGPTDAPDGLLMRTLTAGHPSPLLVRRDGAVEETACSGRLVGVLPDLGLRVAEDRLAPGDCVVLFTDGLMDARTANGQFFGETDILPTFSRLRGLPLQDMVDTVTSGMERYDVRDDAAVLAVRYLGPRILGATLPVDDVAPAVSAVHPEGTGLPEQIERYLAECRDRELENVRVTVDGDAAWTRIELTGLGGATAWAELTK